MNKRKKEKILHLLFLFSFFYINFSSLIAQEKLSKNIIVTISKNDSIYYLTDKFIIKNTLKVYLDSLILINGKDYLFETRKNFLKFLPSLFDKKDTANLFQLNIVYNFFSVDFQDEYKHRELYKIKDSGEVTVFKTVDAPGKKYLSEMFGSEVQTSGSLVRGFTFGTNRDLTLNSGFRMQMSGQLAKDVDISASLTDENIPIQPEGNTQTLQEIDKVFMELKAKNMSATLGDFNLNLQQGEFASINRKLQGALGSADFNIGSSRTQFLISGAISKGKYHTNYFNGIEGVQGPYRLIGKNNERFIIVIAGTERVYVDGELMKRGDDNDYIIDYSTGEITFAPRRLINGSSRIVVDFEYTDRQYARNFLTTSNTTSILKDKVSLTSSLFYEADDYKSPIDLILNETEKDILKNAGDDRNKTKQESAQYVGRGKGQYAKKDTVIDGVLSSIYIYSPNDTTAEWAVSFSYVGENKGDYIKLGAGNFKYTGRGKGNYLPVRFLLLPQQQTLIDLNLQANPFKNTKIYTEAAFSNLDENRFSSLDDDNNKGTALKYLMQFNPENVFISDLNLGSFDFKIGQRLISNTFNPIDRINDVEYNRKWNLAADFQKEERTTEASLAYKPLKNWLIGSNYGNIKKGSSFKSDRFEGTFNLTEKIFPSLNYRVEYINSFNRDLSEKGKWLRQLFDGGYDYKFLSTNFKFEMEDRKLTDDFTDTIKSGSFKFYEYSPKVAILNLYNTNLSAEYKIRKEYLNRYGVLLKESDIYTQIYSITTTPITNLYNNFDLTFRRRNYTKEFKSTSGGNTETILIRWLTRFINPKRSIETDWLYNISTQKSAKLEKVFQKVQKGNGSYIYLGDLDSNGVATEDEFRPTRFDGDYILLTMPSELLYPVIDLKLNWRFKLIFSKLLNTENIFGKIFSPISTETFWRVEEKNSYPDQKKIYFLNFSYFLNDDWTIYGNQSFQQDIYLFENSDVVNLRFRFNQRKMLAKYSIASERSYYRERNVRIRWQLIEEMLNTIEYENKIDILNAEIYNYRVRNLYGNFISSDWNYRPDRKLEIGFKIRIGKLNNKQIKVNDISYINTQNIRINFSFKEKGVIRGEINREEVTLEGSGKMLSYELTEGRIIGKTYIWRIGGEYRFTKFIQASMGYEGRKEGGNKIINQLRGEVRAFF